MPVVVNVRHWETSFREQVREFASGWNVVESRGRVRLKVRPPGQSEQSVVLPFDWNKSDVGDAYVRIRNIYKCSASTSLAAWRQSSWPVTAADRPQVVVGDSLGLVAV